MIAPMPMCTTFPRLRFIFLFMVFAVLLWIACEMTARAPTGFFTLAGRKPSRPKLVRVLVTHDNRTYQYFEDWLDPLWRAVDPVFEVTSVFSLADIPSLSRNDVLAFIQSMHPFATPARKWFFATEPTPRPLQGVEAVVDYSYGNIRYWRQFMNSTHVSIFWLPICDHPSTVARPGDGQKVCMIGSPNTPRRKTFAQHLQEALHYQHTNLHFVVGMRSARNYAIQSCAIIVHCSSWETNIKQLARLRVDLPWLLGIRVISEEPDELDVLEYRGSMVFARFPDLVNKTLQVLNSTTEDHWNKFLVRELVVRERRKLFAGIVRALLDPARL